MIKFKWKQFTFRPCACRVRIGCQMMMLLKNNAHQLFSRIWYGTFLEVLSKNRTKSYSAIRQNLQTLRKVWSSDSELQSLQCMVFHVLNADPARQMNVVQPRFIESINLRPWVFIEFLISRSKSDLRVNLRNSFSSGKEFTESVEA